MSDSASYAYTANLTRGARPVDKGNDDRALRELLRRCSPETIAAAKRYRHLGNKAEIPLIVRGVLTRYVDPERRESLRGSATELRLVEDLGIDSLSLIEMSMTLEDVLGVQLTDEDLRHVRTLGDINLLVQPERAS